MTRQKNLIFGWCSRYLSETILTEKKFDFLKIFIYDFWIMVQNQTLVNISAALFFKSKKKLSDDHSRYEDFLGKKVRCCFSVVRTKRFWTILDENPNFFQGPVSQKMYFIDPPINWKLWSRELFWGSFFWFLRRLERFCRFQLTPQLFSGVWYQILFLVKPPLELKNRTYKGILEGVWLKKEIDIGPQKKVGGRPKTTKSLQTARKSKDEPRNNSMGHNFQF